MYQTLRGRVANSVRQSLLALLLLTAPACVVVFPPPDSDVTIRNRPKVDFSGESSTAPASSQTVATSSKSAATTRSARRHWKLIRVLLTYFRALGGDHGDFLAFVLNGDQEFGEVREPRPARWGSAF